MRNRERRTENESVFHSPFSVLRSRFLISVSPFNPTLTALPSPCYKPSPHSARRRRIAVRRLRRGRMQPRMADMIKQKSQILSLWFVVWDLAWTALAWVGAYVL